MKHKRPNISIVLPAFNEEENVGEAALQLKAVLTEMDADYEIIFIDDGSTDGTSDRVKRLCAGDERIRLVSFRRNFGKSAAIACGFREAAGRVIITMDADAQDDPREIPALLRELESGCDVVSGWKKQRRDGPWKIILSKFFNLMVSLMTGIKLHDFNCGFKVYRREAVENLHIYGELHRFIPVLCAREGFRCGEKTVNHRPRLRGASKYGFERIFKGAFDLLTVLFLSRFVSSPLHLFGVIGLLCFAAGGLISAWFAAQWISGTPMHIRPMMVFGWVLVLAGIQFLSLGLVAELVVHTASRGTPYVVKENFPADSEGSESPPRND